MYIIETIEAISIFPSPQFRAYFRSFMGRNQFKKVRPRPLKSRRQKKYVKEGGIPTCAAHLRHAMHTSLHTIFD